MKKIVITMATAAMTLFAGCQKPEVDAPVESDDVFTASVEEFDAQTKTAMNENRRIVWSTGDRLSIFQGSTIADEYVLADGSAGLSSGSFKWVSKDNEVNGDFGAGFELPCNVAFYPYAEGLLLDGDMLEDGKKVYTVSTVVLPAVQTYAENSFGNGAFPMVAVTQNMDDHKLKFKNVGGALKLQLKGSCVVKSIKVEGKNGEKLSGAATVTAYANNQAPAIKMASDASAEVTLDCGEGVQLNEGEVTNFYVALPPVVFENGFTVTVTDNEDKEYTVSATEANTILRSAILVMPEVKLESTPSGNEGDYVDEYGINHGPGVEIDGVVWAPVNCGYHETDCLCGKFYQWGRKYGQMVWYIEPETLPGPVSLDDGQSELNKNVFFTCNESPYDWLSPQDGTLWNSGTDSSPVKTDYDPCPVGWRVPTYAELEGLTQHRSSWTKDDSDLSGYWFSGSFPYTDVVPQVFFPAVGFCSLIGGSFEFGLEGNYWSSGANNSNAHCLYFDDNAVSMGGAFRAYGFSVRCVRDASATDVPEEEAIPVLEVSLNATSLKLSEEDVVQLEAKVKPTDATYKSVVWSSSDPLVATVDQNGKVTAISAGTAEISAQAGDVVATCSVEVMQKVLLKDYVDEYDVNHGKGVAIGMAVWAPVNCGYHATDYKWGKLYQWGRKYGQGYDGDASTPEIAEGGVSLQGGQSEKNKNVFYTCPEYPYDWLYSQDGTLWNSGTEESPVKTEYDPCPEGWRVPTYTELSELHENRSSWTTNDVGQKGYWFSGPSPYLSDIAQVFFPAAGNRYDDSGKARSRGSFGRYWSSSPYNNDAHHLTFSSGSALVSFCCRAPGYSVRCVQD